MEIHKAGSAPLADNYQQLALTERVYYLLAECNKVRKNNNQRWKLHIQSLLAAYTSIPSNVLKAKVLFEQANYCYMAEGEFRKSLALCNEAKKLFDEREVDLQITFYSLTGTNYHLMGNYDEAQPQYLNGIELLESKLEKSSEDLDSLAKLYYNVGLLRTNLQNKEISVEYLEKALHIYQKTASKSGLARCYNALGHHHPKSKDDSVVSIDFYLKAATYFEEDNDLIGLATAYNNIGLKYGMMRDVESALTYFEKSISLRKQLGNRNGIAFSYFYIGSAYEANEQYDEALEYYHRAEKIMLEIDSKHELHQLYDQVSKTYSHKQNFEKAYEYHQKFIRLKHEIFNFDYKTSLSIENTKLLIEQQEKEAAIEFHKQQELAQYIQKLETAHDELKQMAFIASHDLREPIRMVTIYTSLIKKQKHAELENEIHNTIDEIIATSNLMWKTLQGLLQSSAEAVKNK
jgi:tetratricopeptide (TPR) repeat protein